MLLCEKYAPTDIDMLLVTNEVKIALTSFAKAVDQGKKTKPLLIYGPPGLGKTAAVHALAASFNFKLTEFNASDYRDSDTLNKRLIPATNTRSLFNEKILVLFDEVDELSSKFDSGAEKIILNLLKKSRQPIILIANDYWNRKITFLRNQTDKLEFKRAKQDDVFSYLSSIAKKENSGLEPAIITEIATRSNGDIRGGLNDLEAMLHSGPELIEHIGVRNRKAEIFKLLDKIFLSNNFDMARNATFNTDIGLDMLINWIDQNIPSRYTSKKGLRDAFEQLSRASMFFEHAGRDNYYEYYRYASVIMSSGVSISGGGSATNLTPYSFPSKISYMSKTKKDRDMLGGMGLRLSPFVHTSKKQIIASYLPLLKKIAADYKKELGEEAALEKISKGTNMEVEELEEILEYYSLR